MALFRDYLKVNALESFLEVTDSFIAFAELQACRVSTLPEIFERKVVLLYKDSEGYWNLDRKLNYAYAPLLRRGHQGHVLLASNRFSTLELPLFFDSLLAPHRGKRSKYEEVMSFALTHYCQQEKISNGVYSEAKENIETYIRDDLSLGEALFFLSLPAKSPISGADAAQFLASSGGALPVEWITKMLSNS